MKAQLTIASWYASVFFFDSAPAWLEVYSDLDSEAFWIRSILYDMAPGRFAFDNQDVPIDDPGNTLRDSWSRFIVLPGYEGGGRLYFCLFGLIWADALSVFAMYMMMNYLTNVWNLSITHAAGIINIFHGIIPALAIAFAFFADAFFDMFYILVLSTFAYSIGLGFLFLSTAAFFGPCSQYKEECIGHTQKVLFFTALPLIAVGQACHHALLPSFIGLQDEDDYESEAREQSLSTSVLLKKLFLIILPVVTFIFGAIALPYIKPWSIRFGIPAICAMTAAVFFYAGSSRFKHIKPEGSPLTIALRVFVAAATKDFQQVTKFKQIYNEDNTHSTSTLRWLDKAAIKYPDQALSRSWTLCNMREVEDTKTGIRMVPMLLTFIGTGLVLSLGNTYFLEQANHMDRKLGSIKVQIPMFLGFHRISASISWTINYLLLWLIPIPERYLPSRIAVGMVLSVFCCVTAAIVETRRLHEIRIHMLLDKSNEKIPVSIFFLLPQFLLLGAVDGLTSYGVKRFLENQLPDSNHTYLLYLQKLFLGLGSLASVLSVYVVGKVNERNNNPNWFQHTSNKSHLDRFYWTLAALSAVNFVIYTIVAYFYKETPSAESELIDDIPED